MTPQRSHGSLARLLTDYRTYAGLTQDELCALSYTLASQGKIEAGFLRPQLSRYETGKAQPDPGTLYRIAITLSVALNNAGMQTDGDALYGHLMNTQRPPKQRIVSDEAAELDAVLAVMGDHPARGDIYAALIAAARTFVDRLRWRARGNRK